MRFFRRLFHLRYVLALATALTPLAGRAVDLDLKSACLSKIDWTLAKDYPMLPTVTYPGYLNVNTLFPTPMDFSKLKNPLGITQITFVSEISKGGMGVVYRVSVETPQGKKDMALKVVKSGMEQYEEGGIEVQNLVARVAESKNGTGPEHVVQVRLRINGVGKTAYLMDLVDNTAHTLTKRGGPLSLFSVQHPDGTFGASKDPKHLSHVVRTLWRMARDVSAGAFEIGEARGVHRDIKPTNIVQMGDHYGIFGLLDFGLSTSKNFKDLPDAGTPGFMAPETKVDGAPPAHPTQDIYSIAASFYTMISNRYLDAPENMVKDRHRSPLVIAPEENPSPELVKNKLLNIRRHLEQNGVSEPVLKKFDDLIYLVTEGITVDRFDRLNAFKGDQSPLLRVSPDNRILGPRP